MIKRYYIIFSIKKYNKMNGLGGISSNSTFLIGKRQVCLGMHGGTA